MLPGKLEVLPIVSLILIMSHVTSGSFSYFSIALGPPASPHTQTHQHQQRQRQTDNKTEKRAVMDTDGESEIERHRDTQALKHRYEHTDKHTTQKHLD